MATSRTWPIFQCSSSITPPTLWRRCYKELQQDTEASHCVNGPYRTPSKSSRQPHLRFRPSSSLPPIPVFSLKPSKTITLMFAQCRTDPDPNGDLEAAPATWYRTRLRVALRAGPIYQSDHLGGRNNFDTYFMWQYEVLIGKRARAVQYDQVWCDLWPGPLINARATNEHVDSQCQTWLSNCIILTNFALAQGWQSTKPGSCVDLRSWSYRKLCQRGPKVAVR